MRILIGGDVSVKQDCEQAFADGNTKQLFNDVLDAFSGADRVLVNLECAVTDKDTPIKKIGPNLNAPINTVKTLKQAGVTDCGLSNNHIFDFCKAGIKDTINQLEKYEVNYTGFGDNQQLSRKDLIMSDGNIKVAIIAVCEHEYSYALENRMGARVYDPYDTNEDIAKAKEQADYVIVTYHGGKEEFRYPSPRLVKACRSMIKSGADVVLCQHSHCIGCYEQFMGGKILYGQGNFHFVCKAYEDKADNGYMWNTGLLAQLDITKDELKLEFIPTTVEGAGIRLATPPEAKRILSEMAERSKALLDGSYKKLWHDYCLTLPRYRIVPDELKEKLAHFIDCEAHLDVLKEVFQTYNITNEIE